MRDRPVCERSKDRNVTLRCMTPSSCPNVRNVIACLHKMVYISSFGLKSYEECPNAPNPFSPDPTLFDTAVSFPTRSDRVDNAAMSVSGVPHNPKPAQKRSDVQIHVGCLCDSKT